MTASRSAGVMKTGSSAWLLVIDLSIKVSSLFLVFESIRQSKAVGASASSTMKCVLPKLIQTHIVCFSPKPNIREIAGAVVCTFTSGKASERRNETILFHVLTFPNITCLKDVSDRFQRL
jgi:hypothetical protein